ncbi:hypothetical protein ACSQ67_019943 [Phaseolus vulgaris]|uniref:Uncharacterized protein n=1 Tax=Phaseolus vulgaris TaxID=3885 RepID=V7AY41_PHAVU|nr:hypothetical protein PHAVU_009G215200g [Phaseolus vulgaris]ESW10504.1 hypothetical protein PHAVU_009G215200g [Phaseolus vulgaris]
MAEKPVQDHEGTSASSSTSVSVPASASPSNSVSLPVSASSSTPVSSLSSTSASVSVASSASAFVTALVSASVSTSPSALSALSKLASAAWATESAPATSTTRATESTSRSSLVAWTLTDELPIKLEGVINLVAWKQQVMRVLIKENLLGLVINPVTPIKYANQVSDVVREEYEEWVIHDEKVRTWLLSSLSEFMCSFVTGWEHAWEVWSAVHEICRTELINKLKIALRAEIKNTKKENQSVTEYVSRVTSLISALVGLGDEVSEHEHVEAILEGLPEEYESLRAIIRARSEHATVSHLESLMLIQETLVNNLNNRLPLHSVLPLGNLHLDDGAGRGRGSGSAQGGGRGRRRGGGRRRDGT